MAKSSDEWIEPPPRGFSDPPMPVPSMSPMPLASPIYPLGPANPLVPLGNGLAMAGTVSPAERLANAKAELWKATGVPDLLAAGNALSRGEVLPAIGQGAAGALALAGSAAPVLRAGATALRFTPGVLRDTAGTFLAYHGTPHLFEAEEGAPLGRFRNEAIGSGEGAQAYGWGHYVAGNPSVAKSYQNAGQLDNQTLLYKNSSFQPKTDVEQQAHFYANNSGMILNDKNQNVPYWDLAFEQLDHDIGLALGDNRLEDAEVLQRAKGFLHKEKDNFSFQENPGALLEVHVLPEESELLDWDKPFSQQEPAVQQALQPVMADMKRYRGHVTDPAGEDIYHDLGRNLIAQSWGSDELVGRALGRPGDELASKALHAAGIPGIKYLDQGSRQAPDVKLIQAQIDNWLTEDKEAINRQVGSPNYYDRKLQDLRDRLAEAQTWKPTYNYVIFDPSNLRIIGRNGQRLEPVDYDPFAAQGAAPGGTSP